MIRLEAYASVMFISLSRVMLTKRRLVNLKFDKVCFKSIRCVISDKLYIVEWLKFNWILK